MKFPKCVLALLFLVLIMHPTDSAQAISPPVFTPLVSENSVRVSWSAVNGAKGYFLSYAPSPYTGPDSIVTLDVGTQTTFIVTLNPGTAFFAAVQARDEFGVSAYSNIEAIRIPDQGAQTYQIFGFNDLGMHCYDSDFSVFSILPLFNVLHAQIIRKGASPEILKAAGSVTYKSMADTTGSINTSSEGKTDFWDYVLPLFGASPPVDEGLLGAKMPGTGNTAQPFHPRTGYPGWFSAEGIPITAVDDNLNKNTYPLMMVQAADAGTLEKLSSLPVVVPVSDEMACGACHNTGNVAAVLPGVQWSDDADPGIQYRENILILHDYRADTDLVGSQPVLCAGCHYSPALDLSGTGPVGSQVTNKNLSHAVHGFHASRIVTPPASGNICFYCHPGEKTQCARGAMQNAGIRCMDCHGNLYAVGRSGRQPWADLPRCESCHTGDAVSSLGNEIIGRTAYADSPDVATFVIATNKRFAEQAGILYRNSEGHHGVACESCHGSPHAIWPSRETNDNLAAIHIQGHDGKIIECTACHGSGLARNLDGPHGLHNVGSQTWVNGHEGFFEAHREKCQACHGLSGDGTVLSKAAATRNFSVEDSRTVNISKGVQIGCGLCHENELREEED